MSRSKYKALWDFISLSGGEVLSKIAGFLAFAYLSRVLDPQAYGSVELAVALLVFFTLIVDFGYGPVGVREIANDPESASHYAALISSARLILALAAIPVMCGVAFFIGKSNETRYLIWIFSLALLAVPWNQRWLFQAFEKMGWVSFCQVIRMIFFALGVFALVHGPEDLLNVGMIEVGACVAMALFFVIMQRREHIPARLSLNFAGLDHLNRQALSIGLSQVVWSLSQYLPTLMVAWMLGETEVAWFGAAHRVVISLVSFSLVYHFNLFPAVARSLKESHAAFTDIVRPSIRVTAWGGVFIALMISFSSKPLCIFVFGSDYANAALPMAALIWLLPLTLLSGHARWALIASHHQKYVLIAQIFGAVATVIMGIVLIPRYGALGGSITMVCSQAVVWFVAHFSARRMIGPIPFVEMAIRPIILAGIIVMLVFSRNDLVLHLIDFGANPDWFRFVPVMNPVWYGVIFGAAGFVIIAPLSDRFLISDIIKLIHAKNISKQIPECRGES